jgi:hypothetical protein
MNWTFINHKQPLHGMEWRENKLKMQGKYELPLFGFPQM